MHRIVVLLTLGRRLAPAPTLAISVLVILMVGCASTAPLQLRVEQQEAIIASLREDNARFQESYYQIKEILDSESAEKGQRLLSLQQELEKSQHLKSQRERELADELNLVKLQYKAFQEEAGERQRVTESALARLQHELGESLATRDAALTQLQAVETDLAEVRQSSEALSKELAAVRGELEASQAGLATLTREHETLSQSYQAEQVARQRLEGELETARAERGQALEQVTEVDRQLQAANERAEAATREIEAVRAELTSLRAEDEKLRAELTSAGTARQELVRSAEQLGRLESQLAQLNEDKTGLEARLKESQDQVGTLRALIPPAPADDAELTRAAGRMAQLMEGHADAAAVKAMVDERGLRIILPSDFLFESGSTLLAERAQPVLDRIGELLAGLGGRPIRIEGHTDNQPVRDLPFADNWGLGFSRADRVRDYLMRAGRLDAARVQTLTRAHHDPLAGMPRRVEVVVAPQR